MAMMKYKLATFSVLMLAFAAAGAQVASHTPTVFKQQSPQNPSMVALTSDNRPVARVNGSVLTDADLVREEYSIFPYARLHNGLPKSLAPEIREGALKMIIFEELVYQEALRRKMTVPATRMQRAEAEFRAQFATPDEFNEVLKNDFHGSRQALQEKIRRSLLIDALMKIEIDNRSTVSPAEVRAYYDKNPALFHIPESFTFQTISVLPPANATPQQLKEGRTRADEALRQAKATKTAEAFGLLAEKISDDDYRVVMGQHKAVPVAQLAPQVTRALLAMKPGDVSDVIQIEQAYTIVRLNAHTPAGKSKFDDVKAQLDKQLKQTKTNQLRAALDKKLRENARIEVM
jgi:PPIC-type PPIASE domain